jgi:DNA-directed RNA polymerase specialized sigma24 family protein
VSVKTAGRIASAPGVAEQFEAMHREYFNDLAAWLRRRLPATLVSQSEDFAQEAFIELWAYLGKGKTVAKPFGLLMKMAQRKVWSQQALRSTQQSFVTDLNDPASVALDGLREHRYAAGDPMLSIVVAELETAHERMAEASERWRSLHNKLGTMKPRTVDSSTCRETLRRAEWREARRVEIRLQRDEALAELQEACRVVAQLRGELERVGGGSWRSCSGWPSARYSGGQRLEGVASDPTAAECSKGHCLKNLERVSFSADGTRMCRDCRTEGANRKRVPTAAKVVLA